MILARCIRVRLFTHCLLLATAMASGANDADASQPVRKEITGCVVGGALISRDGYRIRVRSAQTRKPLDLSRYEGREVRFVGSLLPGDNYDVATDPTVLGPCQARQGWLGARVQTVTPDIAAGLGIKVAAGALVADVIVDSPAGQAGLRRGDVILKIDGMDVATAQALVDRIRRAVPGVSVRLSILRRGQEHTLTIRLQASRDESRRPPSDTSTPSRDLDLDALLGISVEMLSDESRSGHGIAGHIQGVVITRVQPTQTLLKVRDVIIEVDQESVRTPAQLFQRVDAVRRTGRKSVLLTIADPQGATRFAAVPFSTTAPPVASGARTQEHESEPPDDLPELEPMEDLK